MKLNVKIGGDVTIYLTPDADPVTLDIGEDVSEKAEQEDRNHGNLSYFESAVNVLKELMHEIGHETDESDDADDNELVMVLAPGKEPQVMTFAEADDLIPGFYDEYEGIDDFLGLGVTLYHRKNQIIRIGDDEFLVGAAVVCYEDEDGYLWSMGGRDIYRVFQRMANHHAVLSIDGKQITAIDITGTKPEEEGE